MPETRRPRNERAVTKVMISFTDPQLRWLRAEAKRLGVSVADLVRRSVDAYRFLPGMEAKK